MPIDERRTCTRRKLVQKNPPLCLVHCNWWHGMPKQIVVLVNQRLLVANCSKMQPKTSSWFICGFSFYQVQWTSKKGWLKRTSVLLVIEWGLKCCDLFSMITRKHASTWNCIDLHLAYQQWEHFKIHMETTLLFLRGRGWGGHYIVKSTQLLLKGCFKRTM